MSNPLPVVNNKEVNADNESRSTLNICTTNIVSSEGIPKSEEVLLCGPSSIIEGFINEQPAKLLVDTGASITIVNELFQRKNMPNIPLRPGHVNATSVTGDPVHFKGIFSASLRIGCRKMWPLAPNLCFFYFTLLVIELHLLLIEWI